MLYFDLHDLDACPDARRMDHYGTTDCWRPAEKQYHVDGPTGGSGAMTRSYLGRRGLLVGL